MASAPSQLSDRATSGSPRPARGLSRRRFLVVSSSGLAAIWAGGLGRRVLADSSAMPLSVGYLAGSSEVGDLDTLVESLLSPPAASGRGRLEVLAAPSSTWRVRPADRLPMGDQRLAGSTVGVRVLGLYPEALDRTWFESAQLEVLFPAPPELLAELGPDALLPHFAWSLGPRSSPAPAPPNRFRVPLGPTGGLDLRLRVSPGSGLAGDRGAGAPPGGEAWSFATRFTVDWEESLPRLRRGIYFLGLTPITWEAPVHLPTGGSRSRPDLCSILLCVDPLES
ncbi:MAG: hypothetical protein KDD47_18160 [Acidobacteria bacterium]|nr:hypothetical protein [Acidobacteriota bacterium]